MRRSIVLLLALATACGTATDAPTTETSTSVGETATTTSTTTLRAGGPVGRRGHAMASLGDGQLLVVGGWTVASNATVWLGDSWLYDTRSGDWTEIGSLPQRGQSSLAARDGEAIIFGGYVGGNEVYGDTRALRNDSWLRLDASPAPDGRAGSVAAFDESAGVYVMFGGDEEPFDARIAEGETWTFNGEEWTDLAPTPSPQHRTEGHPVLFELAMDYDSGSRRIVLLIGGDETWGFDTLNATWDRRTAPDSAADFMIAAAYHAGIDRTITYGGAPTALTQETWGYDYDIDTWELIPTASTPGPIGDHAMAYDPVTDAVYLFGGVTEPLGLGDPETPSARMWRFDGTDWFLVWDPDD